MKKGQIIEGTIERAEFSGKGIMTVEDRKVIVKHTLPGQKVRARVVKARSGKCEAMLLEVLEKAPEECGSDCPHFDRCGGCSLRNLPYEDQLALKEKQVRDILEKACPDPHFEGIKASPLEKGYRNKMEFSFGDAFKDGPLTLGLHARGSRYDVITTDECRIVHEDYRKILRTVLKDAADSGLPAYRRGTHEGYFRHLLVRRAFRTGEILVILVTSSQVERETEEKLLQTLTDDLKALDLEGEIVGFGHTVNDRLSDVIDGENTKMIFGRDHYYEELMGLRFLITPFSFFQNNTPGAEVLYETAREYAGVEKEKEIYDLYSGTGTIAQMMSPAAEHVTGIELVEEAVEAARENAKMNGIENCTFIAGDVLKELENVSEKPSMIILDPPREGIHPKALTHIIDYGVEKIVYISCKPTSLARDLESFLAGGYKVTRSCCVDMFCGTDHVETVALLQKEPSGQRSEKTADDPPQAT